MELIRHGDIELPWLTLGDLIRLKAREHGDQEAVRFDDKQVLTCEELDTRSDHLAGALAELGVRKGGCVASLLYNSPEQLLVWLAAVKIGAIAAPINVSVRGVDLAHVLRDLAPTAVILETDLLAIYEPVRGELPARPLAEIVVGARRPDFLNLTDLEVAKTTPPLVEVSPADPACVLFTGGTTGLPKGVLRPHFSYICTAVRYREIFRPTSEDRHYASTHLFHTGGQEIAFVGPLFNDIPTVIPRWFSASQFWPQVRRFGCTIMEALGPILELLLRQPPQSNDRDNPVRVGLGATQGVFPERRRDFEERFGVKLLEDYALTEFGSLLIANHLDDERPGSMGKPRGWCEVAIVDDMDRALPAGEVGQIVLRPTIPFSASFGYYGHPEATVERWRNLWVHTGDLGYLDEDEWLYFTGRMAHWIRRRAENVACREVEEVIDAHPQVVESAVVGVAADVGDEDIKAFVVVREGSSLPPEEIVRWCQDRLAYFKIPRYIQYVDELPRSVSKREIERHRLKTQGIGKAWDREAAERDLTR